MSDEQAGDQEGVQKPKGRNGEWLFYTAASVTFACVAGLAALLTYVPRYKATHLIEANTDFFLFRNVFPESTDLAETEKPILLNALVLDTVLADPAVRNAPSLSDPRIAELNLRENLTIERANSNKRMQISYIDTDRDAAANVCNAVVSSYLRVRADADQSRVRKLETLLIPEIDHWKSEVEHQKDRYRELARTLSLHGPSPAVNMEEIRVEQFKNLSQEIFELEKEIEVMKATRSVTGESLISKTDDGRAESESSDAAEESLIKMETRLAVLTGRYETLKNQLSLGSGCATRLQFAEAELERSTDILNRLQDRAAQLRTERRRLFSVQSLAKATAPRVPLNQDLHSRVGYAAAAGFFLPLLIGALRPRKTSKTSDG